MDLSQTFQFEHWTIKYSLLGPKDARPVVFVHGTPWSSVTFQPLAKSLLAQDTYRVLLYDLPGYGQSQEYDGASTSSKDPNGFQGDTSVKFQGLALSKLLDHLQLNGQESQEAPAVVAHDIAGTIALRCLLFHECRFRSLLLMDTNTVLPWGDGFYKMARAEPAAFCNLPSGIFESVLRGVIRSACFSEEKLRAGWEDSLAKPWLSSLEGEATAGQRELQRSFVRQIAQANDADVAEMLDNNLYEQVSCPVKILWGENDQWIPREKMERLAGMLKHCLKGFVVIPEAGHLIMVDQPERVAVEVVSWLFKY